MHQNLNKLNKSNKKKLSKTLPKGNDEVVNLDNELRDLIKKNESLKNGISKMFRDIEKKNNTNNSN